MMTTTLLLAFLLSLGLFAHFVATGQLGEAAKMILPAAGIFTLLAACLSVRRAGRNAGF